MVTENNNGPTWKEWRENVTYNQREFEKKLDKLFEKLPDRIESSIDNAISRLPCKKVQENLTSTMQKVSKLEGKIEPLENLVTNQSKIRLWSIRGAGIGGASAIIFIIAEIIDRYFI